jgi:hypothetical protein
MSRSSRIPCSPYERLLDQWERIRKGECPEDKAFVRLGCKAEGEENEGKTRNGRGDHCGFSGTLATGIGERERGCAINSRTPLRFPATREFFSRLPTRHRQGRRYARGVPLSGQAPAFRRGLGRGRFHRGRATPRSAPEI